jgi:glucose/arabinose dehydrogenase/mono/diheme cytochrome c family protein
MSAARSFPPAAEEMIMGCHYLNRNAIAAIVAQVPLGGLLLVGMSLAGPPLAQSSSALAQGQNAPRSPGNDCTGDNGGITLPRGFCATVFADNIGHARHLVVSSKGVVFVNTWSGRYYGYDRPPAAGFLVALQDSDGDGRADVNIHFGDTYAQGSHGGTGIALYKDGLYAEVNDRIVRYGLPEELTMPAAAPQVIVSELPLSGDHPMHPFVMDSRGHLYVNLGSATNSCQARNRVAGSPGLSPCTELETRAGTWRYDADRTGQHFSPADRFASGIRNGEGFAFDQAGRLYVMQHGRDQLAENWPDLYRPEQGADQPAEELLQLDEGGDYGWPQCYFDGEQQKLVLAPEYGGDGGKAVGPCALKRGPVAWFPAHWAPNDLAIYNGAQFPGAYQGGAFIAFHGSWNRAPFPQQGYNVVFQPLSDGKPSGPFVVFADGFAGAVKEPGQAAHRPSGLAVGPDGALYISDDVRGRIWRVTFHGNTTTTGVEPAPAPRASPPTASNVQPPEGLNSQAGEEAAVAALAVPEGATRDELKLGARIFRGQEGGATCAGCHGSNAKGTTLGPDLTSGRWLWGDGSLAAITHTIETGVSAPKEYRSPMPPMGGTRLSKQDLDAVAAYVWALGHQDGHGRR